jgi:hypothetical protein
MRIRTDRLVRTVTGRSVLRVPAGATDVRGATLRYLMFGLLPAWFIPGLLDWLHRKASRLPTPYLGSVAGAIATLVVLPYGEELLRCWRGTRLTGPLTS